ncbi:MAG: TRAP transporter solute receptor TAXI family protein [Xanthobacteraceae bacterium]|nr:MAG: TRAP transporter solute receptor TAXI family protein [Xanthobacteraceae bacterium]
MSRRTIAGLAALVALVGLSAGTYWFFNLAPIQLRMAVAPAGSETAQFFAALAQTADRENYRVRLALAPLTNVAETSAAIDAGDVDLAIARADYRIPATGLAVAILHQNVALLVGCSAPPPAPAPATSRAGSRARPATPANGQPAPLAGFADLKGRRVVVVGRGPGNPALFEKLAAYHGLAVSDIDVVLASSVAEVAAAMAAKRTDALFMAFPRGDAVIGETIRAMGCTGDRHPALIPLAEGNVFQARNRVFSAVELVPGELGTNPLLPAEAISTLGFPSLLVARRGLPNAIVEEFTRQLFTQRHGLMSQFPAAGRIEALPTDRGSAFTLHPGASRYYDAEEKGFFERYETLIYVILFGFSGILSAVVWLWRYLFPRRQNLVFHEHHVFEDLIARTRAASSIAELDDIVEAMDRLLGELSQNMLQGKVDIEMKPAFDIMSDRLTAAIAERRSALLSGPASPPPLSVT